MLQAQLAQGPVHKAELIYRGELAKKNTRLLTAAFTAGLLEASLTESVNIVNAELLAQARHRYHSVGKPHGDSPASYAPKYS